MKKEIAAYVARCDNCCRVKAIHLKSAHFIPVRIDYRPSDYAELYFNLIVCLHGVPRTIISDRGPQFTARFFGTFAQDDRDQLS